LIALLRSVAVSWQQHEQSQNAREIARRRARTVRTGGDLQRTLRRTSAAGWKGR
jgi:DNA anti-recombination protein RmuC